MAKGEPATAAVASSGADSDLSNEANMKLHVRLLLTLLLAAVGSLASGTQALAQTDPLPSWNDGPAKQAIVEFVHATTDQPSPRFVPCVGRSLRAHFPFQTRRGYKRRCRKRALPPSTRMGRSG
jgi:hypothetical protein